jgi:hypothetical protein
MFVKVISRATLALVLIAAAGSAWAFVLNENKALKIRPYTYRPVESTVDREFTFFKNVDAVGVSSRIYKEDREEVTKFFADEVGVESDGVEKGYTSFTKRFNVNKEEFGFANFVTRFWTPNRFIFFADYVEKLVDENREDFGITITASREDMNRFMFNYFTGKENSWNPDVAYTAFKREFGIADDSVTFAFFRDYIYVPGLLRTFGNKTIIGLQNANVTSIENTRIERVR